jgi:fluoride exporter
MPTRPPDPSPARSDAWAIAAGGAVGTAARAALLWAWPASAAAWPALFAANVVGALALGALLGGLGRREGPGWWRSPFFATGVLGSFTTFSTLTADALRVGADRPLWAAASALATVAFGLAAALLGGALVRGGRGR